MEVSLQVVLQRPSTDDARQRWNRQLEFPQHEWMSNVTTWDEQDLWRWPNLPFLLRAHGTERIERYGGVDPGKGVDNDYAAILCRAFDSGGKETEATGEHPLVSAEWADGTAAETDGSSIVHHAVSETLRIPLIDGDRNPTTGTFRVWLIYADFLDSWLPESWPEEPEDAGGILACFDVVWRRAEQDVSFSSQVIIPPSTTGFDWKTWKDDGAVPVLTHR